MFTNSLYGPVSAIGQRRMLGCLFALASMTGFATSAQAEPARLPSLMPEQEEIAAALEGLPPHLRDQAGVFVLRAKGYERVREARNGFNCVLIREWSKSFESQCYDSEGTDSILPLVLLSFDLLAK